jgi:hypothetical protein
VLFVRTNVAEITVYLHSTLVDVTLGQFVFPSTEKVNITNTSSNCVLSFMNMSWILFEKNKCPLTNWYSIDTRAFDGPKIGLEQIIQNDKPGQRLAPFTDKFPAPLPGGLLKINLMMNYQPMAEVRIQALEQGVVNCVFSAAGRVMFCGLGYFSDIDHMLQIYWYRGSLYMKSDLSMMLVAPFSNVEAEKVSFLILNP